MFYFLLHKLLLPLGIMKQLTNTLFETHSTDSNVSWSQSSCLYQRTNSHQCSPLCITVS